MSSDYRYLQYPHDSEFRPLLEFLGRIPAIKTNDTPWGGFGTNRIETGLWWIKFEIDINHGIAWSLVQEFGYVLNCLSIEDRLPTVFKPVSPPPYLNGGPGDYLSWIIECWDTNYLPSDVSEWLAARLPDPIEDISAWLENR